MIWYRLNNLQDRKDYKNILGAMRARLSSAKAIAKDAVNYCTEVPKIDIRTPVSYLLE